MKQLKKDRMIGYFRSIALNNDFIRSRMKEVKNGRPLCGCGACHECYYVYMIDNLSKSHEQQ